MKSHGQMSEAFITAIFLTLSGGFQDAYTYTCRGKVFANAQTGNIVLMSSKLFDGQWIDACKYLIPLLSFCAGIYTAEYIHRHYQYEHLFHWRQAILILEILLLFCVGFVPETYSTIANAAVSFVCAMQVQTFRKVSGNVYASTMCIGNMRSAMASLCAYNHVKDKKIIYQSLRYLSVIFIFAIGASLGYMISHLLGVHAIWISCGLLLISFSFMFIQETETA